MLLLILSGCSQGTPTAKSSTRSTTSERTSKPAKARKKAKKAAPKATLSTLVGHAFVQQDDQKKAIRVLSSTSGYYLETLSNQDGDFESTDQGIFAAQLTLKGRIFTFTGKAQPQATSNTVQFQLTKKGLLKQLPDGPFYKKVPKDDLDQLNRP
ncbi:hypothetical protein LACPH_000666 [Lacticaseibacillus parahuelsenbergensis]|uniref:Lipoprotein n=1 Tax=Lacticaseibacillus parahuelsenbergensis TaxID=3068305 RepID=A0ABY9L4S3_9LACO|nr:MULTISPECIES: hypothetical protein [Lacticaseibacillus]MDE3281754.1 hypothetical protein [Lacticaseibacillus casei]WLV78689.1 hypothetical protein LACPH_000666 [Lacticaseibacillus sp. NCIMB 15471]